MTRFRLLERIYFSIETRTLLGYAVALHVRPGRGGHGVRPGHTCRSVDGMGVERCRNDGVIPTPLLTRIVKLRPWVSFHNLLPTHIRNIPLDPPGIPI